MNNRIAHGAVIVAATLLALPAPALAQGAEEPSLRPNRQLLTAGAITWAIPYAGSVVAATASDHDGDRNLFVPLAGPWMDLVDRGGCGPAGCDDAQKTARGLLIADGIVQAAGAVMLVGSLVLSEKHAPQIAARAAPSTWMSVAPGMIGRGAYGLAAFGAF